MASIDVLNKRAGIVEISYKTAVQAPPDTAMPVRRWGQAQAGCGLRMRWVEAGLLLKAWPTRVGRASNWPPQLGQRA